MSESTVAVFTHKLTIDGRLFGGERLYPGDRVPLDIDEERLRALRNIGWIADVPAAQLRPPSEAVQAARQERLEASQQLAREEEEQARRLIEERDSDLVWQATQRMKEAEQKVHDAEHEPLPSS